MSKQIGCLFKKHIRKVLAREKLPSSDAAVNLLAMIAAHESGGFKYVQQLNGPALGLLQMEPYTYHDLQGYAAKRGYILPSKPYELVINNDLAIKAARLFFMRKPQLLPEADDIDSLATYAKQHWNTEKGKASVDDYANAYRRYCV